jgi:DeoR/GlpR family transcriptional regulator of sugar metabolism
VAFAQICPIDRVHALITDAGADAKLTRRLRDAGVEVTAV